MTQDELKQAVAQAAVDHVLDTVPADTIIGVGTGSTANLFIDALAAHRAHFRGAVASSEATRKRLVAQGFTLFDLNEVESLPVYVDGADEIDPGLHMIKGGGGALTREKIVAAVAERFVCIADGSKRVATLGRFPLPIEVIPMARAHVARQLSALGGDPVWRQDFVTDNGNLILDIKGLQIHDPKALEAQINQIPGVVTNGLFALRPANVLLLGTENGVEKY